MRKAIRLGLVVLLFSGALSTHVAIAADFASALEQLKAHVAGRKYIEPVQAGDQLIDGIFSAGTKVNTGPYFKLLETALGAASTSDEMLAALNVTLPTAWGGLRETYLLGDGWNGMGAVASGYDHSSDYHAARARLMREVLPRFKKDGRPQHLASLAQLYAQATKGTPNPDHGPFHDALFESMGSLVNDVIVGSGLDRESYAGLKNRAAKAGVAEEKLVNRTKTGRCWAATMAKLRSNTLSEAAAAGLFSLFH